MNLSSLLPCPNTMNAMGPHLGLYQNGSVLINHILYTKWKCRECKNIYISTKDYKDGAQINIYGLTINNSYKITNQSSNELKSSQSSTIDYDKLLFDEYKFGLYSILSHMNLYEKIPIEEIKEKFPDYHGELVIVDALNELLNEIDMEVTYLNNYYIIVEPGVHKRRLQDIQNNRITKVNTVLDPDYRNDISTSDGKIHLRRDETGRIASDICEDKYD